MRDKNEQAQIVKIVLIRPHTHGGRDYEPGAELVLGEVEMNQIDAVWLIANGVASDAS